MNSVNGRPTGLKGWLIGVSVLLALVLAFSPAAGERGSSGPDPGFPAPEPVPVAPDVEFGAFAGNPVLEPGPPDSWNESIFWPSAVYHDGVTYLFYTGAFRWPNGPTAIGLASSTDGITFRSHPNPILTGDESGFDAISVGAPVVLLDGDTWVMYYCGDDDLPHFDGYAIGRATAPDPAGPWVRDQDPVLTPGPDGDWDGGWVAPTGVLKVDGRYIMFYMGGSLNHVRDVWLTGLATSEDGVHWTKHRVPQASSRPPYAASHPVLLPGALGEWDAAGAYLARVRLWRGGWELFYTGRDADGDRAIGYAWSADGIEWVKHPANPILSLGAHYGPDGTPGVEAPAVLVDGPAYSLYYSYSSAFGLASGLIDWPIVVGTTIDELEENGNCSLREAILAANTDSQVDACLAGQGHDRVIVPAGTYRLTLRGVDEDLNQTGDLDIWHDLTLQGAGAGVTVIDGHAADRVLHNRSGTLIVRDLTITNGWVLGTDDAHGGGLLNDSGSVTVERCIISDSVAAYGGGVHNRPSYGTIATLVINDSAVIGNRATGDGGGILSFCGACTDETTAVLTVARSTIAHNVADGSIDAWSKGNGGGIASGIGGKGVDARLAIQDSTIHGNEATGTGLSYVGNGGGVFITAGEATLVNSTISDNRATGAGSINSGYGGGLYVAGDQAPAIVTLTNLTVARNKAAAGGAGLTARFVTHDPFVSLSNTLFADNGSSAGIDVAVDTCYTWMGTLTSLGYNLEDGDSCRLDQPGDLPDTDAMLRPLADNGGPTWTHALPEQSPAVDAGRCDGFTTDQRGEPRPKDHPNVINVADGCDIGAYEVQEDTIAPEIVAVVPADGLVNVPLDAPVVIYFSEPMNCESLCDYCEPYLGGWSMIWNDLGTVVTRTHDPMAPGTTYTVTVTDACDVAGNSLAEPYAWSFTTQAAPEFGLYLPFLLK